MNIKYSVNASLHSGTKAECWEVQAAAVAGKGKNNSNIANPDNEGSSCFTILKLEDFHLTE